MTHALHRKGSEDSLQKDFVLLGFTEPRVTGQTIYKGPLQERFKTLLRICKKHNPIALAAPTAGKNNRFVKGWEPNMNSGIHHSSTIDEIIASEETINAVHAVYSNKRDIGNVLSDLKQEDLGISITVSGLFDEIFDACKNIGVEPHTAQMSLGIWGKKELLPKPSTLETCTLCGHSKVSSRLIETLTNEVKEGVTTTDRAAIELVKQCTCNIFNTSRAIEIINKQIASEHSL